VRIQNPRDAIRHGIGFVTEDRKLQGLVLGMTVRENATLASLRQIVRLGVMLDLERERRLAADLVNRLGVRTPSLEQEVANLSGGNQQKVVVAKWLATRPRILILDEPTRGIDVGAKLEIYRLIEELAASGIAVLVISSELPELLGLTDRIAVMREGRIVGELPTPSATEEALLALAMGQERREAA
jgi:ABC-type sugar transport system ATPase subunit